MKAIKTKYHGPGNVRGARVSASDEDGNRVCLSWDHALDSYGNHRAACKALLEKMRWDGIYHGGGLKDGYVWTCASPWEQPVCRGPEAA